MKDHLRILATGDCTGCECCTYICPQKCISMVQDDMGFYVPRIDESLCIGCGLCHRKCPAKKRPKETGLSTEWMRTSAKENEIDYSMSSSGGTVSEIARAFIENGGIYFSTAFDANWEPVVVKVTNSKELYKTQGSKYVQSRMKDVYRQVREILNNEKKVLFVGTPCQVDALKSYIGNEDHLLYTVDLLCAGVASPGVFEKYISEVREKYSITHLNFRDKSFGYGYYLTSIENTNGKHVFLRGSLGGFSSLCGHGYVRESCLHCKYRSKDRVGDISVGDHERACLSEAEKRKGANFVAVNTSKGRKLLYSMQLNLEISEVDPKVLDEKLSSLPFSMSKQREKGSNYEAFHRSALSKSWTYAYNTYLQDKSAKSIIQRALPLRLLFYLRNRR